MIQDKKKKTLLFILVQIKHVLCQNIMFKKEKIHDYTKQFASNMCKLNKI
jgi:hypothetical protein